MRGSGHKPEPAQELNARRRKLTKEIQNIEAKIALLETQKKELDSILLDPTLYNNKEKSVEINKQHKTIIQELSTLYNGWDTIHAELESVNDNQCDPV
ncbi:MAG TPA: ABC transporter C-terminal domain-containing protein [Candidatus Brocadiaceae bacterium]